MPLLSDRTKQTTTSTGTGSLALTGTVAGFRAFADAHASGSQLYYCVTDGTAWEVGLGTFTAGSPGSLARNSVLASSNSNALVNWGVGTKEVFVTLPAAVALAPTFTGQATFEGPVVEVANVRSNTGASITLDGTKTVLRHTADQNTTITLPSAPGTTNGVYTLTLSLVVSGTSTVSWAAPAGETIKWAGGTAPTLATGGKDNLVTFIKIHGESYWRAALAWKEG